MVVGIAGPYCSGKNEVARRLVERYGFAEIDVDRVGHEALRRRKEDVVGEFGSGIVDGGGDIDRRALGRIVFDDRERLEALERIVHPEMVRIVSAEVKARPGERLLINAALLVYMRLDELCDAVIAVHAPAIVRVFRALRRDRHSFGAIRRRMRGQRGLKFHSDRVDTCTVRNVGTRSLLDRRVNRIARSLGLAECRTEFKQNNGSS